MIKLNNIRSLNLLFEPDCVWKMTSLFPISYCFPSAFLLQQIQSLHLLIRAVKNSRNINWSCPHCTNLFLTLSPFFLSIDDPLPFQLISDRFSHSSSFSCVCLMFQATISWANQSMSISYPDKESYSFIRSCFVCKFQKQGCGPCIKTIVHDGWSHT